MLYDDTGTVTTTQLEQAKVWQKHFASIEDGEEITMTQLLQDTDERQHNQTIHCNSHLNLPPLSTTDNQFAASKNSAHGEDAIPNNIMCEFH